MSPIFELTATHTHTHTHTHGPPGSRTYNNNNNNSNNNINTTSVGDLNTQQPLVINIAKITRSPDNADDNDALVVAPTIVLPI